MLTITYAQIELNERHWRSRHKSRVYGENTLSVMYTHQF